MASNTKDQRKETDVNKISGKMSDVKKSTGKCSKLLIAICGLPGRGKSQVAQYLARRPSWNGEFQCAKVMSVSDYRRKILKQCGRAVSHELFRPDYTSNVDLRELALRYAMLDCINWLADEFVAILDATLVTRAERAEVFDLFSGQLGYRVLFIECACDDPVVLERNYKEILRYSADYNNMDPALAEQDLRFKIAYYSRIYEPIDENIYPRISFNTGTVNIETHNVSGQMESGLLEYLVNVPLKPHTLYFSRHGESVFNVLGRIGGNSRLSPRGECYAKALANKINEMRIPNLHVLTSRFMRAIATARGVNAPQERVMALDELYAGDCEGLSYEEIQERYPQEYAQRNENKILYRYPRGESYVDVMNRVEPVIAKLQKSDNILVVSHQAVLRCILGYFLRMKMEDMPYMEIPLHTIIRVTSQGYNYKVDFYKLPIDCVNTCVGRGIPNSCSTGRTADNSQITVHDHFDTSDPWRNPASGPTLVQQH